MKGIAKDDERHGAGRAFASVVVLVALGAHGGPIASQSRAYGLRTPLASERVLHGFLGQLTVFREVSIWRPPWAQ